MGLLDRFRRTTTSPVVGWPYPVLPTTATSYGDGGEWGAPAYAMMSGEEYDAIIGMSSAEMWRTQPYLRTVVTFLARNIAQLGLHAYQRVSEDDRQRVRDGVGAVVARPNLSTTTYELVYGLVADLALYDRGHWLMSPDPDQPLARIPVPWVSPYGGDALSPEGYRVRSDDRGGVVEIPANQMLTFHGWHPDALRSGSSPVAALRQILAEQVQAAKYRESVWRRGGKVGAVLTRPHDAPEWGDEARKQFKADWDAQFTGTGPQVGGTPLLEDGMTLGRVDFNAHEMQFIEGSRLALNTVASVYHINPTMIGLLDNANYSNVREFRRMLYGDTLGPILAQIEGRLNQFLVPAYDDREGIYLEFNIEEKLQGSFEEQTAAIQSAVGAPWMSRNEARALRNMPAVDGGDELVTPLNVLVGGQASPTDSAPPPTPVSASTVPSTRSGRLFLVKARITDRQTEQITAVLRRFFARQRDADRYASGGKWDGERWNRELAKDLHQVALSVTETLGKAEANSLGFDPGDYTAEATVNFLQSVAQSRAENINETTKSQLDEALADDDDEADPATVVYDEALDVRAPGIAVGLGTFLAGFATQEAASQVARVHNVEPTKTWIAGSNPRPEHARMDGETVPLDDAFSNGLEWPGDANGNADDTAGCNCALQINLA